MKLFGKRRQEHDEIIQQLDEHEKTISAFELRLKRLEREKGIFKPPPGLREAQ